MAERLKIQLRDNKLLKNERSWRRARFGVIFFAAVHVVIFHDFNRSHPWSEKPGEEWFFLAGWLLFWLITLDWLNMRLRHIDSIKFYRERLSEQGE